MVEQPRVILRINVSWPTRGGLDSVVDEFGMTQVAVMNRLMAWMAAQDDVTQATILGLYPVEGDITERILRKFAKGH